jgi:hypothetical protein
MGFIVCKWHGMELRIGTGFTNYQRALWWNHKELLIGKTITFKAQFFGMKNLPRTPIFRGIRHDI